jgi:hypothetical protein
MLVCEIELIFLLAIGFQRAAVSLGVDFKFGVVLLINTRLSALYCTLVGTVMFSVSQLFEGV